MIEKFTKEELAIIMKEIKELPKDQSKRSACEDAFKKLRASYLNQNVSGAMHAYNLEHDILAICDCFMGNFTKVAQNGKQYKGKYCRAIYINKKIHNEYVKLVEEIVDALARHSRKFEEEEE